MASASDIDVFDVISVLSAAHFPTNPQKPFAPLVVGDHKRKIRSYVSNELNLHTLRDRGQLVKGFLISGTRPFLPKR